MDIGSIDMIGRQMAGRIALAVPTASPTLCAPYCATAWRAWSMKPSAYRLSQASRLLRQSKCCSGAGSATVSSAATRPIQVARGVCVN